MKLQTCRADDRESLKIFLSVTQLQKVPIMSFIYMYNINRFKEHPLQKPTYENSSPTRILDESLRFSTDIVRVSPLFKLYLGLGCAKSRQDFTLKRQNTLYSRIQLWKSRNLGYKLPFENAYFFNKFGHRIKVRLYVGTIVRIVTFRFPSVLVQKLQKKKN